MKVIIVSALLLVSSAQADQVPSTVLKVAKLLKTRDTRTVVSEVYNNDGNPCLPEGKSYNIELQVKQGSFDPLQSKIVYNWETVKTVNSDLTGKIMDVCAE